MVSVTGDKNKAHSRMNMQKLAGIKTKANTMTFQELPKELKQRVAFFLPLSDLTNLAATSESIRSDLSLEIVSSPLTDRHSQSKSYQTLHRRKCFAVLLPKPGSRIHSVTFTSHIQGSRARGVVWIVEQDVPVNQDLEYLKRGTVCESNTVTSFVLDNKTSISLCFPVKPNKTYQFHIMTGGTVHFWKMRLDCVGFGKKSTKCISYQFDAYEEEDSYDDLELCR